ncbi:MAG TPA: 2Fe-2S iron-sulfur cluster binding domain-containing protein, partial [Bacteroidetes bacterium]|nr:2Fe-2S iron-sulfur cluster binding domain-containing protein [Bacteroidota bacterium]
RDVVFYNGRIDKEKLDIIFKNIVDKEAIDNYFLCGPGEMIFFIKDYLNQIGTDKEKIHFELFGVPGASSGQVEKPRTVEEGKMCSITIHEGGKTFTFKATQAAASILDAALQNNADLPFACKGGVCATCRAKLLEGQVEMKTNYALEQDEVNDGFILTCQAVPLTDRVVVDYDR